MNCDRREFLTMATVAVVSPLPPIRDHAITSTAGEAMYGLIGKMTAVAGQRDALASILLGSTGSLPGCLSYILATDPADADALWITEVWDSQASHQASLTLPAVKAAIEKGRPLIAGFSNRVETSPIGGYGLQKPDRR